MLLDEGDKVHVIERRMFESDVRRHFVGAVEGVTQSAMRVVGYVFVYDSGSSAYLRSAELRTRVIPLGASGIVVNVVPADTNIDEVRYVESDGRLFATDGRSFRLDINEFGRSR